MQKFVCTSCGSNQFTKKDDLYICDFCGTSYAPDQVDKLSLEFRAKVDNLIKNAQLAMDQEDWDNAEQYFNKVLEFDIGNTAAIFYRPYAKARKLLSSSVYPLTRKTQFDILSNSFDSIEERFTLEDEGLIKDMSDYMEDLVNTVFVYQSRNDNDNSSETEELFAPLVLDFISFCADLTDKYSDKTKTVYLNNIIISQVDNLVETGYLGLFSEDKNSLKEWRDYAVAQLNEIDPSVETPPEAQSPVKWGSIASYVIGFIVVLYWIFFR